MGTGHRAVPNIALMKNIERRFQKATQPHLLIYRTIGYWFYAVWPTDLGYQQTGLTAVSQHEHVLIT